MSDDRKADLFSEINDLDSVKLLLEQTHSDLDGKVARIRQLCDLSVSLSPRSMFLPGGDIVYWLWDEVKSSFIHGNFVGTVLLAQALAEQLLAACLEFLDPRTTHGKRIVFRETIKKCFQLEMITASDKEDLERLSKLRNPLSHHRTIQDKTHLAQVSCQSNTCPSDILIANANFAIKLMFRLMSLPIVRVD